MTHLRPGYLWLLFRRECKRGPAAIWHSRVTAPAIVRWRNPYQRLPRNPVPVHILCGREQFTLLLWMLASWFHFTERNWKVVVHDDGTLTEEHKVRLSSCLPDARLVWTKEGDAAVAERLACYPRCRAYREQHPLARKIFDIPMMADTGRFILLDADVLFFKKPVEMLDWVDEKTSGCWFNEDAAEASPVSEEEAKRVLKIDPWPKVNSGVCLLNKAAIELVFCERVLAETSLSRGHPWRIEQTLFALCATRYGKGGLLPKTYEVSLGRNRRADAVARHYVGTVRYRFYAEGVRSLKKALTFP